MFKRVISKCLGINTDEKKDESICFNSIKKLVIVETVEKLPDIFNKWSVIGFIDKANTISETILGGTYEFIIQNPNEIPDFKNKSVKYKVNMFNKKTHTILNRFSFNFKYDTSVIGYVLFIKPTKNEETSSNHWNFVESLFYNMGFQIRKKYHKSTNL